MASDANRGRFVVLRRFLYALALVVVGASAGPARADPPILNPQDAACREIARSRVFSAPDPLNLGLREIGRRIYMACMGGSAKPRHVHRGHKKRHRRGR